MLYPYHRSTNLICFVSFLSFVFLEKLQTINLSRWMVMIYDAYKNPHIIFLGMKYGLFLLA